MDFLWGDFSHVFSCRCYFASNTPKKNTSNHENSRNLHILWLLSPSSQALGQAMRKTNKKSLIFHGTSIVVAASQTSPHSHRYPQVKRGKRKIHKFRSANFAQLPGKGATDLGHQKRSTWHRQGGVRVDWGGIHLADVVGRVSFWQKWKWIKWKNRRRSCGVFLRGWEELGNCPKNPDPPNNTPNFGPNKTDGFS